MNDPILNECEVRGNTCALKCSAWTGIIAGALVAVGLSFLLNIFAAAIGLAAYSTSPEGVTKLEVGGYVGMVIGVIAIMFFAGWVAGHLNRSRCCTKNLSVSCSTSKCCCCGGRGAIYGFAAWCLALVLTVLIATQTVHFVASNLNMLTDRSVATARLIDGGRTPMMDTNSTMNQARSNLAQVRVNSEMDAKLLSQSLFLTFGLFFAGAIASAIGGCVGLKPKDYSSCASHKTDYPRS